MTTQELLDSLQQHGVIIKADGDRLIVDAPQGLLTDELCAHLTANKANILKLLDPQPIQIGSIELKVFPTRRHCLKAGSCLWLQEIDCSLFPVLNRNGRLSGCCHERLKC